MFVNSLSDLFHEDVPDDFIARVWAVMSRSKAHTFQLLTKRPKRLLEWLSRCDDAEHLGWITHNGMPPKAYDGNGIIVGGSHEWPLPNVWMGVSVENQSTADERIPILLQAPAAVRFISVEPLLGPVDLSVYLCPDGASGYEHGLDWVIVGGESGPGARPCELPWIRAIIEQCQVAQVPCFVKQLGSKPFSVVDSISFRDNTIPRPCNSKGAEPAEWPADLRVRQWP